MSLLAAPYISPSRWAHQLLASGDFLILDTETTGFGPGTEVVQIGVLGADGQPLIDDQLVRPAHGIPAEATAIHHISEADVSEAPTFAEVYPCLAQTIAGKTVVVYNASYDRGVLHDCCQRRNLPLLAPREWQCAMAQYRRYMGARRSMPLPGSRAHTAIADCRAVLDLLRYMASRP